MKRYDFPSQVEADEVVVNGMAQRPDGDWVRWEDVARDGVLTEALKANVMMEAEVERLRAALRAIRDDGDDCDARRVAREALCDAPEPKPEAKS